MIGIDDSAYMCVQGLKVLFWFGVAAALLFFTIRGEDKRQVSAAYERMLREEATYTKQGQPRPEGEVRCWRVGGK